MILNKVIKFFLVNGIVITLLLFITQSYSQINDDPNSNEIVSKIGLPSDVFYVEIYSTESSIKDEWHEFYEVGDTVLRVFSDTLNGLWIENIKVPYKAYLSEIIFNGNVRISNSIFEKSIVFQQAVFNKSVFISYSDFEYFDFWSIDAHESFSLLRCKINGYTNFKNASFNSGVTLNGCDFKDRVSFVATLFEATELIDFNDIRFDDNVNFDACFLPDSMNFMRIWTEKEIDLSTISNCIDYRIKKLIKKDIPRNTVINLFGSEVSKIKLNFEYFILSTDKIFSEQKDYVRICFVHILYIHNRTSVHWIYC